MNTNLLYFGSLFFEGEGAFVNGKKRSNPTRLRWSKMRRRLINRDAMEIRIPTRRTRPN